MIYVTDACSLIAYVRQEPGWELVAEALSSPDTTTCLAHAVNLMEVFYDFHRALGEDGAQDVIRDLLDVGLIAREDMDRPLWEDAARIKANHRRVSLADCLGLALARRVGGAFLTSDHHELDADAVRALCPIRFIR